MTQLNALDFLDRLRWIDRSPLSQHIEPYRRAIFTAVLDTFDADGRPRYNLALTGRAKKNWKSADLIFAGLVKLLRPSPGGNQCYLLANDEGQAGDDLSLAKKIIAANPALQDFVVVRQKIIERKDGQGFLEILPAQDVVGTHGKTYAFAGFDEIHGYRDWDLLEAMQPDPTRLDVLMWITSYASIFHKPGVPLFDLCAAGRAGTDPRMLFSWYAADYTTDTALAETDPETRANPSRGSWADPNYLEQQRRRLPGHKFRRLHLNLPGLPEGSAFQPDPVMGAFDRTRADRPPEAGISYTGFVDMSGGSSDDACLAVGYQDLEARAIVVRVLNQGAPAPFDPRKAVERFVSILKQYNIFTVTGDAYAGETFRSDFEGHGIRYEVCGLSKSKLYEALEPILNGGRAIFPNVPEVEQQLLGLVWRGGKIDHPGGEHDDWSNAVAGLVHLLAADTSGLGRQELDHLEAHVAILAAAATEQASQENLRALADAQRALAEMKRQYVGTHLGMW
jgi:phage terminase large subunit-like protein